MTDENSSYRGIGDEYASHETVRHGTKEYARGEVRFNPAESFFALVEGGIVGIYHNVSKKLHRYIWQYDFLWNNTELSDGERVILAVQASEGKRLRYQGPVAL